MFARMGARLVVGIAVATIAFGAKEAWAGSNAITAQSRPGQYNWCAPSQGGQQNCDRCCGLSGYSGGLCQNFNESTTQACLCY